MPANDHMTSALAVFGLGACLGLPQGAGALELSDCDRALPPMGYASETRATDLGGGLVSHIAETRVNGDETRRVVLTHCASGREIWAMSACAEASAGFCASGTRPMEAPDAAAALLTRLAASRDRFTLAQVRARLDAAALETGESTLTRETCGCRAAYPGQRKGKARFKMESWN